MISTRIPGSRATHGNWIVAGLLLSAACTNRNGNSSDDGNGNVGRGNAVSGADGGQATVDDGVLNSVHYPMCTKPFPKDPRDDTMTGELVQIPTSSDRYEVLLPQEMLDWLAEQNWLQEHGDWHNVRRCQTACSSLALGSICQSAQSLAVRGLRCAPIQERAPGDGYAFLVMHRHMIRGLRQAFPKHADTILRAFTHVPEVKADPENPIAWIDINWSSDQLNAIDFMENVAAHPDAFTSEDDYARWVQFGDGNPFAGGFGFGGGGFPGFPDGGFPGFDGGFPGFFGGGMPGAADAGSLGLLEGGAPAGDGGASNRPAGGIHGPLHGQWTVPGSPSALTDNNKNVQNFAFWRLHGWIDDMWQRYRDARNIGEDDPVYQKSLIAECEEMMELDRRDAGTASPNGASQDASASAETGVFATVIAPIFQAYCNGCHGALSPTQGLTLAGAQPSSVRQGLVGTQSTEVSMALVQPGDPDHSWLYRKITGNFDGIDCMGCKTTMPLAGTKPTAAEIDSIRSWIAAGATAD
jgi:hypothetical protein